MQKCFESKSISQESFLGFLSFKSVSLIERRILHDRLEPVG